ncbi:N-acetylmuramoyl-L-alanine amidase [Streptomyces sp. 4N509B]|uniref:N-acetylmuramoyl-L-alanine amidase n=1 Tax=Streptomyces sp. 4N509B TaxID=3457413 RepID=UPI003FD64C8F
MRSTSTPATPAATASPTPPSPPHSRRTVLRAATAGAAATAAAPFLLTDGQAAAAEGAAVRGAEGSERSASGLQAAFAEAAARYGVPVGVLLGVSYLVSRWDGHRGAPSVSGGYGPMHLTDLHTALTRSVAHHAHAEPGDEDPRGDTARPLPRRRHPVPEPSALPPALRTLDRAAELTGLTPEALRTDAGANVLGGAALLAAAQRQLGQPPSEDPADWYGAVAAYPGASTRAAAEAFADDVYAVINAGEARTTDSGERVELRPAAAPVAPRTAAADALGLPRADRDPRVEAPPSVSCEWLPAPYEDLGEGDYGNHDKANRPQAPSIDYIVVHDTEATWETTLDLVRDPTYVSWHYSLRSSDGHIAQHLSTKDVGWHAGNWYVNATSVGLEHEGFLVEPDAWYTEAMYRTSARLVRYLARRFDIPLDRHHILGHDQVQGPVNSNIPGMHTDPGPFWDWAHYFELLGAPVRREGGAAAPRRGGIVTIAPDYATHTPVFTDCVTPGDTCAPHGSSAVRLHTAPAHDAPLVRDVGTHPDRDGESTTGVNDVGARATTGTQFAVADRAGDWTAIWYLGQKAWFHNPRSAPTAVPARGHVVTGLPGAATIPVYGRAYPEAAAYPADIPAQAVTPLVYEIPADQEYVVGLRTASSYLRAVTFDPEGALSRVVRGEEYLQIQLGHRIGFVRAADVRVRRVA